MGAAADVRNPQGLLNPQASNANEDIDPFMLAQEFAQLGEKFYQTTQRLMQPLGEPARAAQEDFINPWFVAKAFMTASEKILENPDAAIAASRKYVDNYQELCRRALLSSPQPTQADLLVEPSADDKRFKDPEWHQNPTFSFLMQSYLLWDEWIKDIIKSIDNLDPVTAHKIQFYAQQLTNAFSPTNCPWANPQVLRKTVETKGQNLVQGIRNFLKDLDQGQGQLKISMVDREAFQVGINIATTPGKVIFQNDLIQLIQYQPTTKQVHRTPLLLIPPCINKFYIYDLREENSFVRWTLDQGFSVFMISWVNPDERLSHKTFEDYLFEGVEEAIDVVCDVCQVPQINAAGFCIGGNFLASYAAYKTAQAKDHYPLASTTYFATLFDFSNAGDLMVFIDEEQFNDIERKIQQKGYLEGDILARTFNLLRANDLIWSFVINNYLMGQEPQAFDLLFWNSDSTNLPADMYLYYLKNLFLKNLLMQPGKLKIKDIPIDLREIKTPTFVLSTREDHIAPWQSGYAGTQLFSGPTRFVLGGSGHIAGIFNHPKNGKYKHWVGDHRHLSSDEWLQRAEQKSGSWWNEWADWLGQYSGEKITARSVGSKKYPALENAPGSYVLK